MYNLYNKKNNAYDLAITVDDLCATCSREEQNRCPLVNALKCNFVMIIDDQDIVISDCLMYANHNIRRIK